jgi:hypothetical protein
MPLSADSPAPALQGMRCIRLGQLPSLDWPAELYSYPRADKNGFWLTMDRSQVVRISLGDPPSVEILSFDDSPPASSIEYFGTTEVASQAWTSGGLICLHATSDGPARLFSTLFADQGAALACLGEDRRFHRLPVPFLSATILSAGTLFVALEEASGLFWLSSDPMRGDWRSVPGPRRDGLGFGLWWLWGGAIYLSVEGQDLGFELWRGDIPAAGPWNWTRMITDGAARFAANPGIRHVACIAGLCYLATGDADTGDAADDESGRLRRGGEILTLDQAGVWEVWAGEVRFTSDGLIVPLAAVGANLGQEDATGLDGLACLPDGRPLVLVGGQQWLLDADNFVPMDVARLGIQGRLRKLVQMGDQGVLLLSDPTISNEAGAPLELWWLHP